MNVININIHHHQDHGHCPYCHHSHGHCLLTKPLQILRHPTASFVSACTLVQRWLRFRLPWYQQWYSGNAQHFQAPVMRHFELAGLWWTGNSGRHSKKQGLPFEKMKLEESRIRNDTNWNHSLMPCRYLTDLLDKTSPIAFAQSSLNKKQTTRYPTVSN